MSNFGLVLFFGITTSSQLLMDGLQPLVWPGSGTSNAFCGGRLLGEGVRATIDRPGDDLLSEAEDDRVTENRSAAFELDCVDHASPKQKHATNRSHGAGESLEDELLVEDPVGGLDPFAGGERYDD